jgi:cephalosporin-C deacetylase-like acetyl esterase
MMMRISLMNICLLVVIGSARADDFQVLGDVDGAAPPKMMASYLLQKAHAALDQRKQRYEQLETPEQLAAWQHHVRDSFLEALGDLPERTPLNARVVAATDCDGYRMEKVIFESQPRHFVTAILYLPDRQPPYPAVLVPCGHSSNGKASEAYQRVSILLAKNGMASFCYDPIEQGERYQLLDDQGKPLAGGTTAHCLVGVGSTLLGRNTATFRVWDGMRAIDYLQSRDEIDPHRIGCTGNSGGGTMTSYLMALDPRIACAAPSCYLCGFRRLLETIGPQDAEQNIQSQIAMGVDHADYILARAPQPTLMCTATQDFFDIDGAWNCFRQAKRFYTRMGFAERVDLAETDAKHGFSSELRVAAVRWMRRWLMDIDDAITEPDFPVASDEQLQCTPRGQVMLLEGARSTYDLNLELEAEYAAKREAFWQHTNKQKALAKVRQVSGIRQLGELPACEFTRVETAEYGDQHKLHKLVLRPEPGIVLPALAFVPKQHSGAAYLYLHADGKQADAGAGGPIARLVDEGNLVLAVDLRGLGETGLKVSNQRGIARHIGPQWKDFYLAYLLGKSYLAMRTEDILVCARFLGAYERDEQPNRVHLVSVGRVGPPALHAAALEPDLFASLTLRQCLDCWSDVLSVPMATNQFENIVHGALRTYDLPDLLETLPEAMVTISDPLEIR